jgi:hypothetical protein
MDEVDKAHKRAQRGFTGLPLREQCEAPAKPGTLRVSQSGLIMTRHQHIVKRRFALHPAPRHGPGTHIFPKHHALRSKAERPLPDTLRLRWRSLRAISMMQHKQKDHRAQELRSRCDPGDRHSRSECTYRLHRDAGDIERYPPLQRQQSAWTRATRTCVFRAVSSCQADLN